MNLTDSTVILAFPGGQRAGLRVLVAEDSPALQKLTSRLLTDAGWEVVVVSNGLFAVEAVLQETFDLVLMDLEMPEMGGVEATRALRRQYSATALPIFALTGHEHPHTRSICLAAGMNDVLAKPLQREDLDRLSLSVRQSAAAPSAQSTA